MKRMLILCTGNSCRSQIAEGWIRQLSGDKMEVFSAGIETHGVNPRAIRVMAEADIDISGHTSNHLDEYADLDFDFVLTVCDNANERCPVYSGKSLKFHHHFPDPAKTEGGEEEVMFEFRSVRDMIQEFARTFINEHL